MQEQHYETVRDKTIYIYMPEPMYVGFQRMIWVWRR